MLMRSALFWDITQRRALTFTDVSGQRISPVLKGQAYRPHPQGPISKTSWPLRMGSIYCPETSVKDCHSMLRNILEEGRFHKQSVVSSSVSDR